MPQNVKFHNFTPKKNNPPTGGTALERAGHPEESNLNRRNEGSTSRYTPLHPHTIARCTVELTINSGSLRSFRSIYMPFRYRLIACLHFRPTRLITPVCFRLFGTSPGPSRPPFPGYPPPRINEAFISSTRACAMLVELGGVDAGRKSGEDKRTEEDRGSNSQ